MKIKSTIFKNFNLQVHYYSLDINCSSWWSLTQWNYQAIHAHNFQYANCALTPISWFIYGRFSTIYSIGLSYNHRCWCIDGCSSECRVHVHKAVQSILSLILCTYVHKNVFFISKCLICWAQLIFLQNYEALSTVIFAFGIVPTVWYNKIKLQENNLKRCYLSSLVHTR